MANFDEIFKKVKDTGEMVAKKAVDEGKKAKEVLSLNTAIMNENKKISSMYEEIGKRYYESHKDLDSDPELEVMQSITGSLEVVEEYKKKLEEIKSEDSES